MMDEQHEHKIEVHVNSTGQPYAKCALKDCAYQCPWDEIETMLNENATLKRDAETLRALEEILNEPIAYCAYPGFEKDDALLRIRKMEAVILALEPK